MAIAYRHVICPPLRDFTAAAPDGAVIGLVGEVDGGQSRLLRLAAGLELPQNGEVEAPPLRRLLGPDDPPNLASVDLLLIDQTLDRQDRVVRERAAVALERLRRAGSTVLLFSHDEELMVRICDAVWWLHEGRLMASGDADETLRAWRAHVAQRLKEWGESVGVETAPRLRRGDGRAEILKVELFGESGRLTMLWRSGELAVVRVRVRFRAPVEDPVVGIMIRTRIGLNVYGTNTEIERLKLGPARAGEILTVAFAFRCELCPQNYTLTVASHDPSGIWHDWLEDAVAFTVTDSRYTAGVANLRATVRLEARE